ncbi:MAG: single-stranded DNA-binding protein [Anaerolineales bacterium]|jgi:single-strand DNA-binding protein|nr:single-stranded DNA-binding protein [Anaerolineales bacterium]
MPTLNRVQLIGRLGKDPESKFTPTGKKVCHFSLAVSNRWKDKNGETKETTEWVNIEAWGRLGEVCQEYLKKGSLIFVEGRLKTDKYEDKGETKFFTKVVAQSLQFLDKRPADEPMMAVDEDPGDYELAGE